MSGEPRDIAAVLAAHGYEGDLEPDMGWKSIRCPYHDDTNASARVSTRDDGYRCLACDASGDSLKLLMWKEHLDYPCSLQRYSEITGTENVSLRTTDGRKSRRDVPEGPRDYERGHRSLSSRVRRKPDYRG